jgi:hypothetical protein
MPFLAWADRLSEKAILAVEDVELWLMPSIDIHVR